MGGEDPFEVPAEDVGERQEAQGLGGRRAVDHDEVEVVALCVVSQVLQGEDLVESGQRRELGGIDGVGPGPTEQVDEVLTDLPP